MFFGSCCCRGMGIASDGCQQRFPAWGLRGRGLYENTSRFSSSDAHKVCCLRKSLYGLHQAPRQWFSKLSTKLCKYGFVRSYVDYYLFVYRKGNVFMALLVYVNIIILASKNAQASTVFKAYLHTCFSIKDLGPLKYFLGIEVASGPEGMFLCQRKHALEIIEECGLLGAKPVEFSIEENHKLALVTGRLLNDAAKYAD